MIVAPESLSLFMLSAVTILTDTHRSYLRQITTTLFSSDLYRWLPNKAELSRAPGCHINFLIVGSGGPQALLLSEAEYRPSAYQVVIAMSVSICYDLYGKHGR